MFPKKSRMFQEMGEFAKEEGAKELRSKYGPKEPDIAPVPGTEEDEEGAILAAEGEPTDAPMDIEAVLASLTPEEREAVEQMLAMG